MVTEITYLHFCNLGALNNKGCFSRLDSRSKIMRYYYYGNLSQASHQGQSLSLEEAKTIYGS
jgi:hypothetical protein